MDESEQQYPRQRIGYIGVENPAATGGNFTYN